MALPRPQDLVFTLFGDYLLHRPGAVWVGSVISLLEPLGFTNGASRTVLSRMSRKGWFSTYRDGRKSFYRLTEKGRKLLEEGEERIYHPPRDEPWDGTWVLLSYSIPEEQRSLRDRLRDRLFWLGFGSVTGGLWISPHDVAARVREIAGELEISEYLELFRATHVGFSDTEHLVARCWDLAALNDRYREFVERHTERFEAAEERLQRGDLDEEECFLRRFELVHEYREFPLADPYLPRSLLPEDWMGDAADVLFRAYHDLLEDPSERYVESILAAGPEPPDLATASAPAAEGKPTSSERPSEETR